MKSTGYRLHSPVYPSFLLPCITVCHHNSTAFYQPSGCGGPQNASLCGQFAEKFLITTSSQTNTRTAVIQNLSPHYLKYIEQTRSPTFPTVSHTNSHHTLPSQKCSNTLILSGDRGSTVVKVVCYYSEGRWFDPSWRQCIFQVHGIFLILMWKSVDITSNRNEYHEYLLG